MSIRVIGFRTEYRPNKPGRDWVEIAPSGEAFDKQRTEHLVSHLIPPEVENDKQRAADTYIAMRARWDVIEPAYKAWKANQELPEHGTPFAAWSGLTAEMGEYLKRHFGIRTVEELAEMSPDHAARLPFPNARKIPETAKRFLSGADAAAKDAELAEMRDQIAALTAALNESKPAKRGRPPKEAPADMEGEAA